ncbi:MAG: O-antigen ligase family protein [Hyphomonadaceae bacterium]
MHAKTYTDRIVVPLVLIWGLWPIATFSGGKLFAPFLFTCGLIFGLKYLRTRPQPYIWALGAFLIWVCLSAFWSPVQRPVISGSLIQGTFAIEAAQVRFLLSALGISLFVSAVAALGVNRTRKMLAVISVAVLAQLAILIWLIGTRDSILLADGEGMFMPSPQSLGRNANLLAIGLPILAGIIVDRVAFRIALPLVILIGALGAWVIFKHDALAGLLGWGIGCAVGLVLYVFRTGGFRLVFNMLAAAVMGAPLLAKGLLALAPPDAVSLPLSAEQRLVIWQAALEKISAKPVIGHGVNAVHHWDETLATRPDLLAQLDPILANARLIPSHIHNMPLQIWAETGAIGALLFAVGAILLGRALPAPQSLSHGIRLASAGVIGSGAALFFVAYSAWDESFWASLAVATCALLVLAKKTESS